MAQRKVMLISGGGFCLTESPASEKRSTGGGTDLCFTSPPGGNGQNQSATNATSGNGLLQKCFEML
jgi:hypothetical protein